MKVLILGSRPYLAQSVRAYLEQAGFEVVVTGSGPCEMALGLSQYPDLVLLEVAQPDPDGLDACRQVRSRSSVPLIAIGPSRVSDTVAALRLGADDYIARPFHHRELLAHVRALLRRAGWSGGSAAGRVCAVELVL